ncbi:MAG: AMP-binding protein [Pseudomonadota bacterium]
MLSWFQSRKPAEKTGATGSPGAVCIADSTLSSSSTDAIEPTQPILPENLAYASAPADLPLVYKTVGQCLDEAATNYADLEGLVNLSEGVHLTFAEMQQRANDLARAMIGYGLDKGDRIALWSPNCTNWILLQLASAKAGVILVTVNPAYRAQELGSVLNHSGARILYSARSFRDRDFSDDFTIARSAAPSLESIVVITGESSDGFESLKDFERHAHNISTDALRARELSLSAEDPINIQYTSGTTGQPKGATLTHHNMVNNAIFIGRHQDFTASDRLCLPVPLFHCFGNVLGTLSALIYGTTIVMPGEAFDPKSTLEAIHQERCTALYSVPMMFIAILNHPDFANYDLSSLRTGVSGAAPCPAEVMKDVVAKMHMTELTICYGMTETSPISTQTKIGDDLERQCETVGTLMPHLECKIVNPATGQIVSRGEEGEYCVRGYSVMAGYWQNPEATSSAIDSNGWMHSGDLAVMRDDGYIKIVGRAKDIIIRGGENIQPRDVEEFFHTLPEVEDVQVIGVPDETYGEAVCAWIKLTTKADTTSEALQAACKGNIATFKIPKHIRFVEDFPMTASGKVQKFRMREIMTEELGP